MVSDGKEQQLVGVSLVLFLYVYFELGHNEYKIAISMGGEGILRKQFQVIDGNSVPWHKWECF